METSYHSYPKVYALGHPSLKELFDDEVVITEKIDGSQFSFGVFDGEIKMRSKGQQIVVNAPEKMFLPAVETVLRLKTLLADGFTYRAEFLSKPKHNALAYNRVPEKHLILFDINNGYESYLSYDNMVTHGVCLGLEVVPHIYQGEVTDTNKLIELLERESILGGQKIEGIVIKNYHRFGRDKKVLIGKYVSEKYKEVHTKEWKNQNPSSGDFLFMLMDKYRSERRWEKAVQHLKEIETLVNEPKDIAVLMKEVKQDIKQECAEEIKEQLFKWAWPKIERKCVAGLPEWYKEKLMQSQFD